MTVRTGPGAIYLDGRCLADDADHLLVALRQSASQVVNIERLERMHMAVAQVLLALRPTIIGLSDKTPASARIVIAAANAEYA